MPSSILSFKGFFCVCVPCGCHGIEKEVSWISTCQSVLIDSEERKVLFHILKLHFDCHSCLKAISLLPHRQLDEKGPSTNFLQLLEKQGLWCLFETSSIASLHAGNRSTAHTTCRSRSRMLCEYRLTPSPAAPLPHEPPQASLCQGQLSRNHTHVV